MASERIRRDWRLVKQGKEYGLRQVDHFEGKPPEVVSHQPRGFQQEAKGVSAPDLYENLMRGARLEIEEAFDKGVLEI